MIEDDIAQRLAEISVRRAGAREYAEWLAKAPKMSVAEITAEIARLNAMDDQRYGTRIHTESENGQR